MNNKKKPSKWNGEMEEWLKEFFLDPFTTYLDETEFRIDIYETDTSYIVEALLRDYSKENITITAENNFITIFAFSPLNSQTIKKQRTIFFPFSVDTKKITAVFTCDILEIFVCKHSICTRQNKLIPIH
ncbi:Hsp20/alpha crystallin family protein [Niallia sp. 01092]|uniref:Hsp20/alpha crystallin family protein n=1 Tax=unclassified Niallia TaxID=2837522 RepID=UPI003FD49E91